MTTQRNRILDYLKIHGRLNSYYATYSLNIKQAPTRVRELRDMGYAITSKPEPDRSVTWVLDSQGITPSHRSEVRDGDDTKSLTLEEQYIFLPSGRAVLREEMEPRQEALI